MSTEGGGAVLPHVPGVIRAAEVAATAAAIARVQQPDGGIPWSVGEHIDAWNHVQGAMGLLVGGEVAAAEAAYDWSLRSQRPDGSWALRTVGDTVEDAGAETNMAGYLAVGLWHHWLVRGDRAFVERCWSAARRGLDFVAARQLPFGGIAWAQDARGRVADGALLAGSSSLHQALRAGLALAELLDEPQPGWELVAGRLGHALVRHRDLFLDKSRFSMDWYYPILGGPLRGDEAEEVLARRWDDFVVPGLGVRCVVPNPWVTGAETCEFVLALDNMGRHADAVRILGDMQHSRHPDGLYWTGWVFGDDVFWPGEQTTYTAATVILAADALSRSTAGSGVFRGDGMVLDVPGLALECGCSAAGAVTGR